MKKTFRRKSIILKCASDQFLPLAYVFGGCVILHGHITPGGGFQGGVLVASAILLVYLSYGSRGISARFHEHPLHATEMVAEIIYVLIALMGVFAGLHFCFNFLFPDKILDSSVLMNFMVGYHVMGGIIGLLILMLSTLAPDDAAAVSSGKDGKETLK